MLPGTVVTAVCDWYNKGMPGVIAKCDWYNRGVPDVIASVTGTTRVCLVL